MKIGSAPHSPIFSRCDPLTPACARVAPTPSRGDLDHLGRSLCRREDGIGHRRLVVHPGHVCERARGDCVDDLLLRRVGAHVDADELTEAEHRDPVRHLKDVVEVVRDQHDREPTVCQSPHEVEHLARLGDAERGRRLVEDDDLRVPHHGLGDRDGLALAAGEPGDRLAHRAERRDGEAVECRTRDAAPCRARRARCPSCVRGRGTCSRRRRGCPPAQGPDTRPRFRARRSRAGCGS